MSEEEKKAICQACEKFMPMVGGLDACTETGKNIMLAVTESCPLEKWNVD